VATSPHFVTAVCSAREGTEVGLLPTAYALIVAGVDFAVAALLFGWPKGELWPLENRFAGVAMAIAGLTSVAAAMLMAGILPELALRVFMLGAIVAFVIGTSGVTPADTPRVSRMRGWLGIVAVLAIALLLATLQSRPAPRTGLGEPHRVLSLFSAAVFGATCGSFQLIEALAIARYWPKSQARSSLVAGSLVFLAGFLDMAALLGEPVPLVGAVTAAVIASSYLAFRMLAQFRIALEGAEGRVPGYALRRFLGSGGMAEVFVAEAVGLLGQKRVAAVKRVRRDLVENEDYCAMFLEEARLAAALHHPNIVEVFAFGTGGAASGVRPYIAMELVDGLSLAVLLRYSAALRRPLSLEAVAEIGVRLCAALDHAHTLRGPEGEPLRIVHRDVSPHNVLISRDGAVKLIDFGIARAANRDSHTQAGHMRGKVSYAAPEQIAAGPVDSRTDVFSLGVLLFEAATLRRPFVADSEPAIVAAILEGRRHKLSELRPDAGELAEVIERAIRNDPASRWPSAKSFGEALAGALGKPLPGPDVLSELVRSIDAERSDSREVESAPILEVVASTTLSAPPSASGDTETVADSVAPSARAGEGPG
jgi:serine/threonine protein kinase